ncbi:MAG: dephospho-CoA kinase [Acidobacteria bacterium]|nr:dephospho-CoA kinase [Acidobacteriota bacterium]
MLSVGLTGGIATGKSYVRRHVEARGFPTIDADTVAREVVAPGTAGCAAVVARFGQPVVDAQGGLDRAALGAIVFADAGARRDLEAIVHPAVHATIVSWLERTRDEGSWLAVADIPLLFETGRRYPFDLIVVAACAPEVQLARVMARDGLTEAAARQRIEAQWPIDEKVRLADYVIRTDRSFEDTDRQVDDLIETLRARVSS